MQNKNSIIIGADSASSYLCNNKLVRLNNTAKKLFIFGNEVMFCSGKKNVVNHIIDMIEIEGDSINKSSLQKALQDLNLPNDTNLFDIEIIICGVKNNKSYICQLSQYKNFQISYNYIDSDNIEVFAAGFKSNKCLDIAKSEFNLCNGIIEDIYINTFNKMVCDEIGGYLNTFYINNNHIKVLHKDIKLDDIILENQILQTDNRIHYVIADMLVGDLLCGNKLKIFGGGDGTGNATVIIDGDGITLDGGAIKWINKGVADQITIYYAISSSSTTHPAEDSSDWVETFTGVLNNNYLWSKTVVTDTTGKKTVTYNCLGNSPDGIKLTKKQYYLSTSSSYTTGGSWLDYQPTWAGSGYIWTRTHIEYISGATKDVDVVYDKGLTESLRDFSAFKKNVDTALGTPLPTTEIGSDYIISPKIGGGYLYISQNGGCSVEIDPLGLKYGNVFRIADKYNDDIMVVDSDGNGIFSGKIEAYSGSIGGWIIEGGSLKTTTNAGIYQLNPYINGSPCMRIMDGKAIFGLYGTKMNGYFDDSRYVDISNLGIYAKNGLTADDFLYSLEYNNLTNKFNVNCDEFNVNSLTYFNDTATFYYIPYFRKGLRIYDNNSSSNYVDLTVTAYDSSASNSYLVNNGSMKIGHRLQVGDATLGYDPNHTFRVVGSSYVTGTSYTNSGTTVTSDKNKKNSISTPSDCYVQLFDAINFRRFKYNDGTSDRYHLGVIAQELEEAMRSIGISSQDFGGLVIDEQENYFVRYDEINMLTALKVKQLEERIKVLEDKLKC